MSTIYPLTEPLFQHQVAKLCRQDLDLATVVHRFGPPPFWRRDPGFQTLVHIILEQQVSLASAQAALDRLLALVCPLTPAGFLELDDVTLRAVGFSRQKSRYCRLLAQAILTGQLDLDGLAVLEDEAARQVLLAQTGIGPWTAEIYLLMVLRRPDAWPLGDRALVVAAREVKGLEQDPSTEELARLGEAWRPWRAVAARILWHHYLSRL